MTTQQVWQTLKTLWPLLEAREQRAIVSIALLLAKQRNDGQTVDDLDDWQDEDEWGYDEYW